MKSFPKIMNWSNLLKFSKDFQNKTPFHFGFLENVFEQSFYDNLFDSYPKFDQTWIRIEEPDKSAYRKFWFGDNTQTTDRLGDNNEFSESWNTFHRYIHSSEFEENFSKFVGIPELKTKHFTFANLKKGGFQYPHAHNSSTSTLTMFFYFVKDWQQGDPGCTYFASGEEDSDILVEPYNLDNTMTLFRDADNAYHGVRYIEKDIERRSVCVIMERFVEGEGWDSERFLKTDHSME